MLLQIVLAPQVKRSVIIGTKHGIWYTRVASRVANQLETLDLRKLGKVKKIPKLHRVIT